jgi:hypothetical protein
MTAILRGKCDLFESSRYAKDPLRLLTSAVPVMANRRSSKPHIYTSRLRRTSSIAAMRHVEVALIDGASRCGKEGDLLLAAEG